MHRTLLSNRSGVCGAAAALVLALQLGCSSQRAVVREPDAVPQAAARSAPAGLTVESIQARLAELTARGVVDEQARAELVELRARLEGILPTAQDPARAHYVLSGVLLMLDDHKGALDHVGRAVALAPNDANLHRGRGMLLGMMERYAESAEEFRLAIDLDPKDLKSWQMLGEVLIEQKRLSDAEAMMRKALAAWPDDVTLLETLGVVLSQQDKREEALAVYQKTIALEPKSARPHYNLGQTYQLMGRHAESRAAFQRVVEMDPDDYRARSKLVQLNQALGDLAARDRELQAVHALYRAGKVKSDTFCREQTTIGEHKVMVFEHFELKGPMGVKYSFHILDPSGANSIARISLGSYDTTNEVAHRTGSLPADVRLYHLDYYRESQTERMHATYGFFKGAPSYDELRKIVEDVLLNRRPAVSGSTFPVR